MVWGEDWLERWALAAVHACCLLDATCSLMLKIGRASCRERVYVLV